MLKFPTQMGLEIYVSESGLICLKQESLEFREDVIVTLTIGQLRSLIKNSNTLIADAEEAKKEFQLHEGFSNDANS